MQVSDTELIVIARERFENAKKLADTLAKAFPEQSPTVILLAELVRHLAK